MIRLASARRLLSPNASGHTQRLKSCTAEKALELKREMVAGQERVVWNPTLSIPAKDFEFTDPEVARLKAAIQLWDSYGVAAERRWLQPLVEILFPTNPASLPLKP